MGAFIDHIHAEELGMIRSREMFKKIFQGISSSEPIKLDWDSFLLFMQKEQLMEVFGKLVFLDKKEIRGVWYRYYKAVLFFFAKDGKRAEYYQHVGVRKGKSRAHLDETEQGLYGIQIFINLEAYFSKIQEVIPGIKTIIVDDSGKSWSEETIRWSREMAEKFNIKADISGR
jgi:hypothetical protein